MRKRNIDEIKLRKDFARLLAIVADGAEPDYREVEAIAKRNGYGFDEEGKVIRLVFSQA